MLPCCLLVWFLSAEDVGGRGFVKYVFPGWSARPHLCLSANFWRILHMLLGEYCNVTLEWLVITRVTVLAKKRAPWALKVGIYALSFGVWCLKLRLSLVVASADKMDPSLCATFSPLSSSTLCRVQHSDAEDVCYAFTFWICGNEVRQPLAECTCHHMSFGFFIENQRPSVSELMLCTLFIPISMEHIQHLQYLCDIP